MRIATVRSRKKSQKNTAPAAKNKVVSSSLEVHSRAKNESQKQSQNKNFFIGWNQNDYNIIALYGHLILTEASLHSLYGIQHAKREQQLEVINFAEDFMNARTFRQIADKVKKLFPGLIGVEKVSLFFRNLHNGEIFTLTDTEGHEDVTNSAAVETSFAKDLYLPDNQIVIFPRGLGLSGYIIQQRTFHVDNDFGSVLKERVLTQEDDAASKSADSSDSAERRYKKSVKHGLEVQTRRSSVMA